MEKLFAIFQSILPQHLISRFVGYLAEARWWPLRKLLINSFMRLYDIDLSETEHSDPDFYPSFNALFTRALRSGAREMPADPAAVVSPADGTISQCGAIVADSLLQAKDRRFTTAQLLGETNENAGTFDNGSFATIYLAPHNYHRIHAPLAGRLRQMTHIPGRLFSVSQGTTRTVSNLFARNERVVFHFDCDCGPVALVMVGALNVGSIETVHNGVVAPGSKKRRDWHYEPALSFERGQELARFNLGSTVIVLFANQGPQLAQQLQPAVTLNVGQTIARI